MVAAGGDGTVNQVVNGIQAALDEGAARAPGLGIVPLGTGNDLACSLEIPAGVGESLAVAVEGRGRGVDVARVNDLYFLNASSGGIGAEATDEASAEAKRTFGALAYLVTGVRKFVSLRPSRGRFATSGTLYEGSFTLFAVGNSERTGGGNRLTPRADLSDGLLDVCIVKEVSRVELAGLLPALRAGEHLDHPAVIYGQVKRLTVEAENELAVNADGEPMRGRQFAYAVVDRRLEIMTP